LREALISAAIGGGIGMMSGDYSAGEAFGFGDRSGGEGPSDRINSRLDESYQNASTGGQPVQSGDALTRTLNQTSVSPALLQPVNGTPNSLVMVKLLLNSHPVWGKREVFLAVF
jgi:hypothetical protein